jgi:pimeloyl-ACP methyl ester carboxylesterase
MLKEKIYNTGIVEINYAEGPKSGPPLVLLHGGGDRWQGFLPIIPSLILRWHVYALDLRGHGKSGRVPGKYRPDHYLEDVVSFLDLQLDEPGILFGSSLGGWIALLAAAQLDDKVRGLILGDPPLNLERFLSYESSEERIAMWRNLHKMAASGLTKLELASALADAPLSGEAREQAKTLSMVDPDVIQYHAEGRLEEYVEKVDLEGALQKVSCPVLLIQGDPSQGGIVSDEDVGKALGLLTDGVHVILKGTGHNLGLDTWEVNQLLRAISGFLESL